MPEQKDLIDRNELLASLNQMKSMIDEIIRNSRDEDVIARHLGERNVLKDCIARVKDAPTVRILGDQERRRERGIWRIFHSQALRHRKLRKGVRTP